jgi:hypothetical protein
MAMSKTEAMKELERNAVSHQQALVNKIEGSPGPTVIKRAIPGGKTLLDNVSREELPKACYTWLRHCAHFTSFTFSFIKDLSTENAKKIKVMDFDSRSNNLEWDLRGKKWLGEKIAENLLKEKVVGVQGDKDGLYALLTDQAIQQSNENWEPYIEFVPFRPGR